MSSTSGAPAARQAMNPVGLGGELADARLVPGHPQVLRCVEVRGAVLPHDLPHVQPPVGLGHPHAELHLIEVLAGDVVAGPAVRV